MVYVRIKRRKKKTNSFLVPVVDFRKENRMEQGKTMYKVSFIPK